MALTEDGRQCSMCLVSVLALVIVKRVDVCRSELDYLSVASQYSAKSVDVRFKIHWLKYNCIAIAKKCF